MSIRWTGAEPIIVECNTQLRDYTWEQYTIERERVAAMQTRKTLRIPVDYEYQLADISVHDIAVPVPSTPDDTAAGAVSDPAANLAPPAHPPAVEVDATTPSHGVVARTQQHLAAWWKGWTL